jgi:hypothetical protein
MNHPFTIRQESGFHILRDDLVVGGTKRRGLYLLLRALNVETVFYAGTTMGHGALALAHAGRDAKKKINIILSAKDNDPYVGKLQDAGAIVHLSKPLPVETLHQQAIEMSEGAPVFPPGFATPEFAGSLSGAVSSLDVTTYPEIWVASVTGTLARALKKTFPKTMVRTVSVVKNGAPCDYTASEKYHQPAKSPPPYPACAYTDAKVWRFAQKHALPGALIWNTAG